jgi:excisionase family DNA binding protein
MYNVGQAATYLGVSAASLRKWSDRGLVQTYRTPGGQRRYAREDLDAFIESMREPVAKPANEPTTQADIPESVTAAA